MSENRKKICIVGAGAIGRAIGGILEKRGHEVVFWDKDVLKTTTQKPLAEVIPLIDFLFLCVPSWAIREVIARIASYLNKSAVVISLAKGIEKESSKTMDMLLEEYLPVGQFVILGGAMLAEELKNGFYGVGVAGVKSQEACRKVKYLFNGTNLRIECLSDVHGVALAGIVKNIYAIGLGIADGLGWGDNQKGWLTAVAAKEMADIIQILGGKRETTYTAAGLGDLIATGYSPYSRNRRVGDELAKSGRCCLESEGVCSLPILAFLLGQEKNILPLFKVLEKIVVGNQNAKTIFENFIAENHK